MDLRRSGSFKLCVTRRFENDIPEYISGGSPGETSETQQSGKKKEKRTRLFPIDFKNIIYCMVRTPQIITD